MLAVLLPLRSSAQDAITPGSIWNGVGSDGKSPLELKITERNGSAFQAEWKLRGEVRKIVGTVENGRISWLHRDVGIGANNYGVIVGDSIMFRWEHGRRSGKFVLRLANTGSPVNPSPAAASGASGASGASSKGVIGLLSEQGPTLEGDVLAPLERTIPDSTRAYIARLKEDLLDEAAKGPKASPAAYDAGRILCDAMLATYDDREESVKRLKNNSPSRAAGQPITKKVRPNWIDLQRERDEAARATYNNQLETPFAKMTRNGWNEKARNHRLLIDKLFFQFRENVRLSP